MIKKSAGKTLMTRPVQTCALEIGLLWLVEYSTRFSAFIFSWLSVFQSYNERAEEFRTLSANFARRLPLGIAIDTGFLFENSETANNVLLTYASLTLSVITSTERVNGLPSRL